VSAVSAPVFARIREACRRVAADARSVRIDYAAAARLVRTLLGEETVPADPAHQRRANAEETLAFVVTLDAVNFGSGWFPRLRKRPGRSGYFTVALALAERFDAKGAWSARELRRLDAHELAVLLGQDPAAPDVMELMSLYARSLADLGAFLEARFGGRFEGLIAAAGRRASRLVELLAEMPLYRDVAELDGHEVPFYKRAQITAADLHLAFEGTGPGSFEDLDDLTLFADNLVPHVLRLEGVLAYAPALERRIEAGELLAPGCREEVEIRACAVEAVERMVAHGRPRAPRLSAWRLDERLWARGQRPASKARPRHRTRSVFY
jgi:hypothetical protein